MVPAQWVGGSRSVSSVDYWNLRWLRISLVQRCNGLVRARLQGESQSVSYFRDVHVVLMSKVSKKRYRGSRLSLLGKQRKVMRYSCRLFWMSVGGCVAC